jgi:uncharacterized protein (TIGR03086 family)
MSIEPDPDARPDLSDPLVVNALALDEFDRRVHAIGDDQWDDPTPCADWNVRALVNHLVYELRWVPPLIEGRTIAEVGDAFEGDQLGDDPKAAWEAASVGARAAMEEPDALRRTVHLSYGDVPARHYIIELSSDLAVHAWDLARGIGTDDRLDPDLASYLYDWMLPHAEALSGSGLYAAPRPVGADASPQDRLIALTGRDPS